MPWLRIHRSYIPCLPSAIKPGYETKFYKDLWAHVPSTRKTVSFTNPAATPTSNINVLSTQTNPPSQSFIKKPRSFAIYACANNFTSSFQKLMPIQINIFFPSMCLHLGLIEDDENKMRMLLDIGSAMNSGNLDYHLWVMS